jgi:hypothetical protein
MREEANCESRPGSLGVGVRRCRNWKRRCPGEEEVEKIVERMPRKFFGNMAQAE